MVRLFTTQTHDTKTPKQMVLYININKQTTYLDTVELGHDEFLLISDNTYLTHAIIIVFVACLKKLTVIFAYVQQLLKVCLHVD